MKMRTLCARGTNQLNILNHTAMRAGPAKCQNTYDSKENANPISITINKYSSSNYNTCQLTHRPTQTAIFIKYGYKGTYEFSKKSRKHLKILDARRATRATLHMDSLKTLLPLCMHVPVSPRLHGTTRLPLEGFSWKLIFPHSSRI